MPCGRVARPEVIRRACRSVGDLSSCTRPESGLSCPSCESLIPRPAKPTSKNAASVTTSPASRGAPKRWAPKRGSEKVSGPFCGSFCGSVVP
jgi:hypothetical protein